VEYSEGMNAERHQTKISTSKHSKEKTQRILELNQGYVSSSMEYGISMQNE